MKINADIIKIIHNLMKDPKNLSKLDFILLDIIQDVIGSCPEKYEMTDYFYDCVPELQSLGFKVSEEIEDYSGKYRVITWE